jgi:hypothetical protein
MNTKSAMVALLIAMIVVTALTESHQPLHKLPKLSMTVSVVIRVALLALLLAIKLDVLQIEDNQITLVLRGYWRKMLPSMF